MNTVFSSKDPEGTGALLPFGVIITHLDAAVAGLELFYRVGALSAVFAPAATLAATSR